MQHPVFIDNDQQLAQFCQQWQKAAVLALDTEFIRTDTFYPIAGLLQVSDGSGSFLIDPLAIEDFSPLSALLADESLVKVLHSCSEDLEVFERLLGQLPRPLFDTQIAAAFDGYGFSLGYQRLTEDMLQVHVAKGETRSNWLQRPLTDSQKHYAALDVEYLPEIYQRLRDSLETKGRLDWCFDECGQLEPRFRDNSNIGIYYLKIKSAWKLDGQQLTLLKTLSRWREQAARELDIPRNRLLKERPCLEIARSMPASLKQLSAIEDIGPKTVRRYGEHILLLVKEVSQLHESALDSPLPRPLPISTGSLLKQLKACVRHRAEQLGLAQELLARKKDYEQLLWSGIEGGEYSLTDSLSGWRKAVIGDELLTKLAEL